MPAKSKTSLGLNQWIGSEYPKRIDFVEDNKIINDELEKRVKNTDLATDMVAGILTLNKVREVSPKPDLSPYVPFAKGYRIKDNATEFVRANASDLWTPRHLHMYFDNGDYMGAYHLNGGRAYYKVPNRNGGNWCEIMDHLDMAGRDQRMNQMDADRANIWAKANDAWNKANDAQLNRIFEIRLAGYRQEVIYHLNAGKEKNGYVVTGVANVAGDAVLDIVEFRILQFHRNGQWLNAYFA